MSDAPRPRDPFDPFDQSQYRSEEPVDDTYGQEPWMLDPYAGADQPAAPGQTGQHAGAHAGAEEPFDWGGSYAPADPRSTGRYDTGQHAQQPTYPPPSHAAPPQEGPPQAPPAAYEQGYEQGYDTGSYQTGAYQTGAYQTGAYETGAYQTGAYDTGEYQTGAYQTGTYDTGAWQQEPYQTGQQATLPPGQGQEEAWPTAAEMRSGLEPMEPEPEAPPEPEHPILRRVRRQRGRGFDATVLASAVLIGVTAIALLGNRQHPWEQPSLAAKTSKPQSALAMCPGKPRKPADTLGIANVGDSGTGPVALTGEGVGKGAKATVSAGRMTTQRAGLGAVTIKAGPEVAAGLVAGRSTTKPLAAVDCAPPQATAWFAGVGAGAAHDSVLELTNPNTGSATVDVGLYDDKGAVQVPDDMRGIAIPGNSTRTFDLLHAVPREGDLALSTTVVRGQISATVRDRHVDIESGAATEDWFAGQSVPARTNRLVGIPKSGDERSLSVANPGDDQVSVKVKLMTATSTISPEGVPDVSVPPHAMAQISLDKVLSGPAGKGTYGIEVVTSGPAAAALRTVHDGDVAVTTAAQRLTDQTALVVLAGVRKTVYVTGEGTTGTVDVVAIGATGKQLRTKQVKIAALGSASVDLPPATALVGLKPTGVTVHAAVVMSGNGDACLAFRPLRTVARSASVAPGLPLPLQPEATGGTKN